MRGEEQDAGKERGLVQDEDDGEESAWFMFLHVLLVGQHVSQDMPSKNVLSP